MHCKSLSLLVRDNVYFQILLLIQGTWVRKGNVADLVQSVRGIRDQLSEENF